MSKRYQHLYRPAKADSYPSQVVIVDCDVDREIVSQRPLCERESLLRWGCLIERYAKGHVKRSKYVEGDTPESFWQLLDMQLSKGCVLWLFAANANRTITLLDFWRLLNEQEITLAGTEPRTADVHADCVPSMPVRPRTSKQRRRDQLDSSMQRVPRVEDSDGVGHAVKATAGDCEEDTGCVILEDPPTLVVCNRRGRKGSFKVVDLRNYGSRDWPQDEGLKERIGTQAAFVHSMIKTLRDNGLGSLRTTSGSQAMYSFRRRLMTEPIYVHNYASALSLERDAYHGGRCEAFHVGQLKGPIYHLDVRSMYPYCAWFNDIPTLLEEVYHGEEAKAQAALHEGSFKVADVTVTTPEAAYPCLAVLRQGEGPEIVEYWHKPFDGHTRGQMIFPVGTFRTVLCGPELDDATVTRRVKIFHRLGVYSGSRALCGFYATWYSLLDKARSDGDTRRQEWIKAVMVSLIGKFGETGKKWIGIEQDQSRPAYDSWTVLHKEIGRVRYRNVAGHTQKEVIAPESSESCPIISSWITSLARMHLLKMIRIAERKNVYYVDTDSVITNGDGYMNLLARGMVSDGTVGLLRLLGVHDSGAVYGIKHYQLSGTYKCSGRPQSLGESGPDGESYWYRYSIADAMQQHQTPEAKRTLLRYCRHKGYRHGLVGDDGRVTPWKI